MTFRFEAEMKAPVVRWMDKQGLIAKSEFSTPWGICDLVGVSFSALNVAKRLANGQTRSIGSAVATAILNEVPDIEDKKSVTFKRLSRLLKHQVDPDRLVVELDRLRKTKFVVSPRKNAFQKLNGWLPLHNRIVAIELKLTRFPDALSQATSHLAFATEAYVAFPNPIASRALNDHRASQLEASGVGLLSVDGDGCEVLLPATRCSAKNDPVLQHACVERFWANHIKGNSSLVAEQCAPAE